MQLDDPDDLTLQNWTNERQRLQRQLITNSDDGLIDVRVVAGLDLSFFKSDATKAVCGLVVLSFPSLRMIYEDSFAVELTVPYIPGFLAFREAPAMMEAIARFKRAKPDVAIDVLFIDGNGILANGFGAACHLGVLTGLRTVGCAKKLFCHDGLDKFEIRDKFLENTREKGDTVDLIGKSGAKWGVALRPKKNVKNPIFVSAGHRITIDTAVRIVTACCKFRVPEPIRQADLSTRKVIREKEAEENGTADDEEDDDNGNDDNSNNNNKD